MSWPTLLLVMTFALGSLAPCALNRAGTRDFPNNSASRVEGASGVQESAARGEAPRAVVRAPCWCGCENHLPGALSLGSLGVALLPRSVAPPTALRAAPANAAPARFVSASAREIEKVPRVA